MNVLIFGLGLHGGGFQAAHYYLSKGDSVKVTDLQSAKELGSPIDTLRDLGASFTLQEHKIEDFIWADIVIKNPAIPPTHPLLQFAKHISSDIIELFTFAQNNSHIRLIAITGTKGKSSLTHEVYHHLLFQQKKAFMCGNIGISAFTILESLENCDSEEVFIVIELSSWQIHDLHTYAPTIQPKFSSIILTSLYPDHLNFYSSEKIYYQDKMAIFSYASDFYYIQEQSLPTITSFDLTIPSKTSIITGNLSEKDSLLTRVLLDLGLQKDSIKRGKHTYKNLPHRQEVVRTIDHITWIDDSAATIPEAMCFTIEHLSLPYILICGGSDKKGDPSKFYKAFEASLHVILIDGDFTKNSLIPYMNTRGLPFSGPYKNMEEIVTLAYTKAKEYPKEIAVLLSPGAASFATFLNSDDRGDQFKKYVSQLS